VASANHSKNCLAGEDSSTTLLVMDVRIRWSRSMLKLPKDYVVINPLSCYAPLSCYSMYVVVLKHNTKYCNTL